MLSNMANHAAKALYCDQNQRKRLEYLRSSGSTAQKIALRASIVLMAADGQANLAIAKQLKISRPTVLLWRDRFASSGVPGIMADASRPGRKKALTPEKVKAIVEATLHTRPPGQTHWSLREMAKAQGLSRMAVQRIWKSHNLQPHRIETFKLSRDKHFVEKLRDVVGLYLSPPEKALVLSVDEKSQIQALDRTQPGLPMKKGRCGTMTHDYKRNGTTTLFAALNMLDGKVIGECLPRHRATEFVKFLGTIDQNTPAELDLHLIVDNYSTHKSPPVQRWLKRHPRFHLHFIPTSSSWLNMIERWFRNITDKAIRRGTFTSVPSLIEAIQEYLDAHNAAPKIFKWTKDADTILAKVAKCKDALGTLH
jgi:transposase